MNARLIYPKSNRDGCRPYDFFQDFDDDLFKDITPFFLLVDRGGCSFSKKIDNAQWLSAFVLIVADYPTGETHDSIKIKESEGEIFYHIPLFEISNSDAQKIK